MSSGDSGQGQSICTPHTKSKRLFIPSGSSSKRNLFNDNRRVSKEKEVSGEESDLGPMSPLAMTDHSETSCDSSPGRNFVSPLHTPENSPRALTQLSWDRLRPSSTKKKSESRLSPFSALNKLTKVSRLSPKRKIFENSPKSLPTTPTRGCRNEIMIGTPEREIALLFGDFIPETPTKESQKTPRKDDEHQQILITPISTVPKSVVPSLHQRRKSLSALGAATTSADYKESTLKRRAVESLVQIIAKAPKIDESSSISRARASLFRDNKNATNTINNETTNITVSTKTFYNKSSEYKEARKKSLAIEWRDKEMSTKNHILPIRSNNHTYHKRSSKRAKFGEMNAGVRHGIKRPKPKRHVSRVEAFKTDKLNKTFPLLSVVRSPLEKSIANNSLNDASTPSLVADYTTSTFPCASNVDHLRSPSPVADPNKRFFITNRTLKSRRVATVTVNNKITLKVSDGKIALNDNARSRIKNSRKRSREEENMFDTTDLTVDEPSFDITVEKTSVDGILKVLADDWADDEYDTMQDLTVHSPARVTTRCLPLNCGLMSPTSVLSNMTSSMNIEDRNGSKVAQDSTIVDGKKMYPLFAKGYSSHVVGNSPEKKVPRGVKRSWQTSAKGGAGENQYQIDAGQKRFGATKCTECGIIYQLSDPEDENAHLNYHNSFKILRFNGWKKERVISEDPFTNSRIIRIEPSDSKQYWKKVEEVLDVVDRDLGLAEVQLSSYTDKNVYFYVRDKTILGVLVAEPIKIAHRMLPELVELDCCSSEETAAKCGINVIWTAMSHRKQRIATKLVDTLRTSFYFGYIMSLDDIAFSIPTPSGKIFAEKYTKTRNFKVYT